MRVEQVWSSSEREGEEGVRGRVCSNAREAVGPGECSETQSRSGGLLRVRRDFLPNLRDNRGIIQKKQSESRRRSYLDKMYVYTDVKVQVARAYAAVSSERLGLSLEG